MVAGWLEGKDSSISGVGSRPAFLSEPLLLSELSVLPLIRANKILTFSVMNESVNSSELKAGIAARYHSRG